jgi:hypothetical protein
MSCKFCYKSIRPLVRHKCLELLPSRAVVEAALDLLDKACPWPIPSIRWGEKWGDGVMAEQHLPGWNYESAGRDWIAVCGRFRRRAGTYARALNIS